MKNCEAVNIIADVTKKFAGNISEKLAVPVNAEPEGLPVEGYNMTDNIDANIDIEENNLEAQMDETALWQEYVEKHGGANGYAHFDKRCSLSNPGVQAYVLNPEKVAQHSFWPFIHFTMENRRAKKDRSKPVGAQLSFKDKLREINYAAHLDSCIYNRYSFVLNQRYNAYVKAQGLNRVAIAYRDNLKRDSCYFAASAFKTIMDMQDCVVFVGDFTEFFDHIDHRYLKKQLCKLLEVEELPKDYYAVYKNITRFTSCEREDILALQGVPDRGKKTINRFNQEHNPVVTKEQFRQLIPKLKKNPHKYGIPQGTAISAIFANIYMLEFDQELNTYVQSKGGRYMRYSDDTIIILPLNGEATVEQYQGDINAVLAKYAEYVHLQKEKTKLFEYHQGCVMGGSANAPDFIDYLGLRLSSAGIGLRPRCITKYYYKMHRMAAYVRYRRYQLRENPRQDVKDIYTKIYACYGRPKPEVPVATAEASAKRTADFKNKTFISYLEKVDHTLKSVLGNKVGLRNDREARVLLRNGWKRKIRLAIKLRGEKRGCGGMEE